MIIDRMKKLKGLTHQERAIVDYVVDNPKAVIEMKVGELAKASYTSSSTVIRLCQKLGFKGYASLRSEYTLEYSEMLNQHELKEKPFEKDTSIDDILNILPKAYEKTIEYTKTMMSRNQLIRITNLLKQADRIEIYGMGVNYDLAKMMAYRFEVVNKDCFVYDCAHWEHLKYLELNHISTIAILLSHTGKNPIILDAAKRLKQSHIVTISISCNSDEALKKISDENIEIIDYKSELELKTTMYTIGVHYILEVFISSLLIYNMDKIEMMSHILDGEREKWMK